MTSTPIFDELAEELDVPWRGSGKPLEPADDEDVPRSGRLD